MECEDYRVSTTAVPGGTHAAHTEAFPPEHRHRRGASNRKVSNKLLRLRFSMRLRGHREALGKYYTFPTAKVLRMWWERWLGVVSAVLLTRVLSPSTL